MDTELEKRHYIKSCKLKCYKRGNKSVKIKLATYKFIPLGYLKQIKGKRGLYVSSLGKFRV